MEHELQTSVYAAVAGFVLGAIVKLINKYFDREKEQVEIHSILRKELREELDSVKEELYTLQKDLDEWKEKYYHQVELTNELRMAIVKLNEELAEYKRDVTKEHEVPESEL